MTDVTSDKINFLEEISNYIFTSKYSKYDEELGRRETWVESVSRLEKMHLKKYGFISKEDKQKIRWAFDLVREKRIVPSMRSLQFGGKGIEAHNSRIYNCAVRHIDSIRSFSEVFYLLLCGCGVGFGLSRHFLNRLPDLVNKDDKTGVVITYQISDTIEGWSDAIEALLNCYFKNTAYTGRKIIFDYSKIRKKGAPLKTGGGKAPGHLGLKNSLTKIKVLLDHIIEYHNVTRLRSIDAYDILMHLADAVLSGGIRRSATSVIFDKDDEDMLKAKTLISVDKVFTFHHEGEETVGGYTTKLYEGKVTHEGIKYEITIKEYELDKLQKEKLISWHHLFPQRARSNNSVLLLRDKVTAEEFKAIVERTKQFGEPGFVFGNHEHQLFNPCQPAEAEVLTRTGLIQFKDLKIGDEIWSETGWTKVVNKWKTGVKSVYKYRTSTNWFLGTENHKIVQNGVKVEVKDAETMDSLKGTFDKTLPYDNQDVMDGLVIGDGSVHEASNNKVYLLIGEDDHDYFESQIKDYIIQPNGIKSPLSYTVKTTITSDELPKTYERFIPERFLRNPAKARAFLRGLFSANGSVVSGRVTYKTASPQMRDDLQLLLSSLGIESYYTTNKSTTVKFSNGIYNCRESYDININKDKEIFFNLIGFLQIYKNQKLDDAISTWKPSNRKKSSFEIKEKIYIGEQEVFDITVDNDPHTYWTAGCNVSNCFEINFVPVTEDGVCGVQFCNLTSMNGRLVTSKEIFLENVEAYTIIGTLQAGYTDFKYLSRTARDLTEDEALLGCSITGMMDNPQILLDANIQKEGAKLSIKINQEWAKKINIAPAARITCIKPEGTSSLVLGTGSGIHAHHARRYFRRVQNNKLDNIYKFFKKHNPILCEPSIWSANKTDDIIIFPIEVGANAMVKSDLNAIQHLDLIKSTQKNWVLEGASQHNHKKLEQNVSCTVIVKPDEWETIIQYLFDNRAYFAAVSLLGASGDKDYQQAPMEAVSTPEDEILWKKIIENFHSVDYTKLIENEDKTNLIQEGSCYGGACEVTF